MLLREFSVYQQSVELVSEWDLASDQIEFVRCQFTLGEEWTGLTAVIAQFQQGSLRIECVLDEESCCYMPHELKVGPVFISVYGVDGEGVRATSIAVKDVINQSGYSSNGSESQELTPDLFTQLIRKINRIIVENGGTGGGGIGFVRWDYDEVGYLHAYDEFGVDVLDPVFIPTLGDIHLSEEDLILAKTYLSDMEAHLNTAKEIEIEVAKQKEAADASAQAAEESASAAQQASEEAQAAMEAAAAASETAKENQESAAASAEAAAESASTAKAAADSIGGSVADANAAAEEARQHSSDAANSAAKAADSAGAAAASAEEAAASVESVAGIADQVKASEEAVATSASEAAASETGAKEAAEEAKQAAEQTKAYAESAEVLKKLEDIEDLTSTIDQAKLYAKASEGYAKDAQEAATKAATSSESAEDAAYRAEEAASQSVANIDAAVAEVNAAKDAAVEEIGDMVTDTVHAAETAKTASAEAQESAESAEASAAAASESEDNASLYAEAAKQVAEKNGYFYFEIEDGRLIETRTENVSEDMNFVIEEGRLILEYA